jgi:hypothetical protein
MMGIPAPLHKALRRADTSGRSGTSRYVSVTQQTRASQPYRHHHRRADEDTRLGDAVGKTITVHERADGLTEIE